MAARLNWLDRSIAVVAPALALRRVHARATLALLGSGSYHGADRSRRAMRNWLPRNTSADGATISDLADLRANSRDLVRSNPIGAGAISTVTTSVIGTGLSVQPQVLARRAGLTPERAQDWQQQAKELFELWAGNPLWADLCGRLNFYQLQELGFRSAMESGDVFSLLPMVRFANEPFATKVQLIEADRVINPPAMPFNSTGWAAGIRCGTEGRPIQLYIADRHPGDGVALTPAGGQTYEYFGTDSGRRNVLHLYTMLRPGQRRGVPYLAPIIEIVKQLGTYTDAEIMAAVVQGAFTVFVTKPPIENGPPPLSGTTDTSAQVPAGAQQGNETGLDYGAMVELREGEQVSFADPGRPNAAFDPFVQAIWTQIGMALELPKEVLTKAFLSSYSAARASLLEAWRFFRKRREWVAAGFCQPVYEAVITEAVLSGRLRAPGFVRDPLVRAAYLRAVWIGDAPGAIDPLKEAKASTERMNNGTSDRSAETIAYSGRNWEDVHAQRVRERRAEERDGIAPPAPAATPPQPTDTPDENEEAEQ